MTIKKTRYQRAVERQRRKVVECLTKLREENADASFNRLAEYTAKELGLTRYGVERIAKREGVYDTLRQKLETQSI